MFGRKNGFKRISYRRGRQFKLLKIFSVVLLVWLSYWFCRKTYETYVIHETQSEALSQIIEDLNKEMAHFDYIQLINRTLAAELRDLTPVTGGSPIRNLIVSIPGSGSSFIEDILTSFPGTFAFHEILRHYGFSRISDSDAREEAVSDLKRVFNCDFSTFGRYLDILQDYISREDSSDEEDSYWYEAAHVHISSQASFLQYNLRVWENLPDPSNYTLDFLSNTCELFPFQAMKLTRLLLKDAGELLEDKKLNLKIIYVIRDPRGVLATRWEMGQVHDLSDVDTLKNLDDPIKICSEIEMDYKAAYELSFKHPDHVKMIRYEDFALDLPNKVRDLFKFLQMPYHNQVEEFVETQLAVRDTNLTVFRWENYLTFYQVEKIQEYCGDAMKLWGYKKVKTEEELKNFIPILEFADTLSE